MILETKLSKGEVVKYVSADGQKELEVVIENESVWLNQSQIADLFGVKQPAISKHIKNVYNSLELIEKSSHSILEYVGNDGKQVYKQKFYNLDMIISVGYRVNSVQATQFRIWATKIIKSYLIKGYVVNEKLESIEKQVKKNKLKIDQQEKEIERLVTKTLPSNQGIFFDGQVFEAYKLVSDIVRSAKKSIVLIDNYLDDTVLTLFSKRKKGVTLKILTKKLDERKNLDVKKFNEQFPPAEINFFDHSHDRFMIIDEKDLYHFGASLKDLGKRWFAFSKMDVGIADMINKLKEI